MRLPVRELERLIDHAVAGFPETVRGLLAGEASARRIDRVVPLDEEGAEPRVRRMLAAEGLEILGRYRSEPDGATAGSEVDRERALPGLAWISAAVHGPDGPEGDGQTTRVTDIRAWRRRAAPADIVEDDLIILPS